VTLGVARSEATGTEPSEGFEASGGQPERASLTRARDTAWAMSEESVDAFNRGLVAYNRRDIDALLAEVDPEVEFQPAPAVLLGGKQTVFRGHRGVHEAIREEDEALALFQVEVSEIRDLGDRILAIGHAHVRGKGSGAEIESPFFLLTELKGTKAISIRGFVDRKEALEAAGLSE
jgi:hypothetical protein